MKNGPSSSNITLSSAFSFLASWLPGLIRVSRPRVPLSAFRFPAFRFCVCPPFIIQHSAFILLLAGLAPRAGAQEALHQALSLDSTLKAQANAPVALEPDQPHWGPVQLQLGASAGASADDNVYQSQSHPQQDLQLNSGLELGFLWPATPQSELRLNTGLGYSKYLETPENDRINIAPGSDLAFGIEFEDGRLIFFDQFSYAQEVRTVASVGGQGFIPRFDNTIGFRVEWSPNRWILSTGYSHDTYLSDDNLYQYLNRGSEYLFVRGGHRIVQDTQAGLEASASLTAYELHLQSDNTSYSFGPFVEWQITHFIKATARGGYTVYNFDAAPGQPSHALSSYYASLEVSHQLTDFITHSLSISRSINLGLNSGNNYSEEWSASYSVNWAATHFLGLHLGFSYALGDQPLQFSVNENYRHFDISPGLTYQLTRKLDVSLNATHTERFSNIDGSAYQGNRVGIQIHYKY